MCGTDAYEPVDPREGYSARARFTSLESSLRRSVAIEDGSLPSYRSSSPLDARSISFADCVALGQHRGSLPRIGGRSTPCSPAGWKIGEIQNAGMEPDRRFEREHANIGLGDVAIVQELPPVVVGIMRHVQDGRTVQRDRPQRDARAIVSLAERPFPFARVVTCPAAPVGIR